MQKPLRAKSSEGIALQFTKTPFPLIAIFEFVAR